ncbi:MAG: GAF domain-containing protein [Anaerolineae bacterium]
MKVVDIEPAVVDGEQRYLHTIKAPLKDADGEVTAVIGFVHDITDRILIEETLRQNEAELSQALKIAKLAYWEYDVEKDLFTFNDQFFALFHTTAEEHGGYQLPSAYYAEHFVYPDDLPLVGAEIERGLNSTDRHYNRLLEHRILYADGGIGYISVNINLERDEQGNILRYYGANQDITERKQAEEALAKRARELQIVSELSTTVATTLEQARLLQEVVDLTKERFDFYHAQVYLLNEQQETLVLAFGAGDVGRKLVAQKHQIGLNVPQSLVARTARSGQAVVVNDVRENPNWLPNELLPETQAEMAVPMMVGGRVVGVLDVQSESVNRFTDQDVQIQTTLAAQTAVAVQNARLFTQSEERETLMRTIIDSTPDWIFVKDRDHRYQMVNKGYADSFHIAPQDFIGKNDLDIGFPEDIVKGNPEKGIRGFWADDVEIMESGEMKVIDIEPAVVDGEQRYLNTIKAPLKDADGEVTAVIGFVHDITGLIQVEEKLAAQARQLQIVAEIATAVATTLEQEKLLQDIVDLTKEQFGLYHAHIYLLDTESETLVLTSGAGQVGEQMVAEGRQIPLQQEKSLVARAARSRQGVIINDVQAEPGFLPHPLLPETRAEMAVPLISGEQVLGVLDVQAAIVNQFTSEDINVFTTLAAQLAVALQIANQYQQIQESEARARIILESVNVPLLISRVSDGKMLYANAELADVVRTPLDELLEKGTPNFYVDMADRQAVVGQIQKQGFVNNYELLLQRATGEKFWSLLSARLINFADEVAIFTTLLDINERKEAENLLAKQANELADLTRRLTREGWQDYLNQTALEDVGYIYDSSEAGLIKPVPAVTNGITVWGKGENGSQPAKPLIQPIAIHGETIGQLAIMPEDDENEVDTEVAEIIHSVIEQLGARIENLRLTEQAEGALMLTDRLYHANRRINAAGSNLQEALAAVAEAVPIPEVNRLVLFLFEYGATGELEGIVSVANWYNGEGAAPPPLGLRYNKSALKALQLLESETIVTIADVLNDERLDPPAQHVLEQLSIPSMAILPLWRDVQQTGCILVETKVPHQFTEQELEPYEALAAQLAVAVDRQNLLDEAQSRAQREQILRQITQRIRSSADVETIMRTAVQEIGRTLGRKTYIYLGDDREA